jgi:hypothetical protein
MERIPVTVIAAAWCLLVSGAAGRAGLSKEMGALIAGVVIASFPYGTEVVSRVGGIRDFFITLFFVALGLKVPSPTPALLLLALAVSVFVILVQFVATYPIFALLRLDLRTANLVGINLGQISEFSLVVFTLGLGYKHVSETGASLVLYTLLLTSVVSTYGILYNQQLADVLTRLAERRGLGRWFARTAPAAAAEGRGGHAEHGAGGDMFLLGVSREGLAFVQYLDRNDPAMKRRLVAIDFNPEMLEVLGTYGIAHNYGDISNLETLRHAGIERAAVVISGISDWFLKGTSNLHLLQHVRRLAPGARVVVTADSVAEAERLYAMGADYVLLPAGRKRGAKAG